MSDIRMRSVVRRRVALCLSLGVLLALSPRLPQAAAQRFFERGQMYEREEPQTNGWLQKMMKQFPQADCDGVLTPHEAQLYHFQSIPQITAHFRELEFVPEAVTSWMTMVPMRDGFELPTAVYFPADRGPWGTVLSRGGGAGTEGALDIGNDFLAQGLVFVQQATRGEGVPPARRDTTYDGYDCIEWIARQPWSNGRVGQMGYSAGGMQNKRDAVTNPPHLTVSVNCIAASRPGGRRPDGTVAGAICTHGHELDFATIDLAGWFDMFTQGQIDDWQAMRHTGKAVLVMGCGGHGPLDEGARLPPFYGDCDIFWPQIPGWKWLTGEYSEADAESVVYYFLMGDCSNPEAPGNLWKVTHQWPPAHTRVARYLTAEGALQSERPESPGQVSYVFDPADPTPRLGRRGGGPGTGPLDQRPLAHRDDIIRFVSDPLERAIEITGPVAVELYVSSDSADAIFQADLIDIYPDGYQWPVLGFSSGAAYADGEGGSGAVGEVRRIEIDLGSTALVVAPGHRIAVHVSSGPLRGWGARRRAGESAPQTAPQHNVVHTSARHPSRVIIPVVAPGATQTFEPRTVR